MNRIVIFFRYWREERTRRKEFQAFIRAAIEEGRRARHRAAYMS